MVQPNVPCRWRRTADPTAWQGFSPLSLTGTHQYFSAVFHEVVVSGSNISFRCRCSLNPEATEKPRQYALAQMEGFIFIKGKKKLTYLICYHYTIVFQDHLKGAF